MEVTGRIIIALPEISGVSKAGKNWKKREYVLETMDNYPQKIAFNFFGDKADQYPLAVGQVVKISFDINSREFNGRWFTDISAWRAEDAGNAPSGAPVAPAVQAPAAQNPYGAPVIPPTNLEPAGPTDDLPF